ncbi:MAG: hypothetical protein ABSD46_02475 [Bacteroidota bacterium]
MYLDPEELRSRDGDLKKANKLLSERQGQIEKNAEELRVQYRQ